MQLLLYEPHDFLPFRDISLDLLQVPTAGLRMSSRMEMVTDGFPDPLNPEADKLFARITAIQRL